MARRRFLPALRGAGARAVPELETKQYRYGDSPSVWYANMSAAARRAWPVERAVSEGMERTVWVFKSVDAIASHAATLDIEVRDEDDDVIEDHPLAELLNDGMVNELETGRQFRERLSAQILLSPSGAFVEVTRNRRGDPIRLDLLPPGKTRPVAGFGPNGEPMLLHHYETYTPEGIRVGIAPQKVLWFRRPHPLDPYRGITPMEAAGLSVDLDYLSRLYNVVFIRNDARPAVVVSVEGKLSPHEADRIEDRFGRGPMESGKVSVVSGGKVSVADLGARPREMAYAEMATRSKEEVLAAFGVGESVLGNSSGRTWDNAEQELYTFWTITMPPHLNVVGTGFRPLLEDGQKLGHKTSTVEVLRRTAAARRQEAREELSVGAISPDEYREIAEHEPLGLPHTRALWLPQGKTPIPTQEGDEVALGLAPPPADDTGVPPGGAPPEGEVPPGGGQPADAPQQEPVVFDPTDTATRQAVEGLQSALDGMQPTETKALLDPPDPHEQAEQDLEEALVQLTRRLVERTAAKANSPKARKGTRHFQPEPGYQVDTRVGDAPIDTTRVVDPDQWQDEAERTLTPVLAAAALAALAALPTPDMPGLPDWQARARRAAQDAAADTARWLAKQIGTAAAGMAASIRERDADGRDMQDIVAGIRNHLPPLEMWASRAAAQAARHLFHAAQAGAAALLVKAGGMASLIWKSRTDDRVRHTHAEADGQVRQPGERFEVGEASLRWPCDITGPLDETAGCRCRLWFLLSAPMPADPGGLPVLARR